MKSSDLNQIIRALRIADKAQKVKSSKTKSFDVPLIALILRFIHGLFSRK